jgi:preprotein translocase subunit SecF
MKIFDNANYDFIRWRWHALVVSALVIVAGAVMIVVQGMPLGIDFSGGTAVVMQFEQAVNEEQVRGAISSIPGEKVVQQYGPAADRQILIRLPLVDAAEQGTSLEQGALQIEKALQTAGLPTFQVISRELVGPVIGADLRSRARPAQPLPPAQRWSVGSGRARAALWRSLSRGRRPCGRRRAGRCRRTAPSSVSP